LQTRFESARAAPLPVRFGDRHVRCPRGWRTDVHPMNFAFHDSAAPQPVTFADVHETFKSPNSRHRVPDTTMVSSSSMPQLHPQHTPIRKSKNPRRTGGAGEGESPGRGSLGGGNGRRRQDHSPVRQVGGRSPMVRPGAGAGSVWSGDSYYSHGHSSLGESTGMRYEREQAAALQAMAKARKVQAVVHKHELRQKLAHAEYLKRVRRKEDREQRKEAHRRLVVAAVRVQKQFRRFLESAKINQAMIRRRERAETVIFKVMIDAWLIRKAKRLKAHLQEVAELNRCATILANCWRNKQNRSAARVILDNLRDAKDKQRERQFRRQRKDGARKVQARVRGMLARKHVRAQAEAERKGVDQVKAAQERLRKMQGLVKSSSTNAAAKNMFIERLKSQKESKDLEKRRRSSSGSTSMREIVNKHLDHVHVMERGKSYALTELSDED